VSSGDREDGELAALRDRLAAAQLAQLAHRRRAIILFEGLEGSGKKFALKQLAGAFDPCHYDVVCVDHDRREAADGHWLARFWRKLPAAGRSMVFYRSWYRRVLDERLAGLVDDKGLARAFDEINEFEAQQRDYGTLIVKLYFDVSTETQERRLAERSANPWQLASGEGATRISHPLYGQAFADLRDNSDTRWSPWTIISGDDERQAAIAALGAVIEAYSSAMPAEPPQLVKSSFQAA
jgi:polyphosphate kinase 2 (PPK2 family)